MDSKSEPTRILIVDDHPAVRSALIDMLGRNPGYTCCGEAESAVTALARLSDSRIDVAIIDISLKDAHGLDLIRDIRARYPGVRIIVYSMFSEEIFAERAIRAGALGYVNKADPTSKVLEAIVSAIRGEVFVSFRIASRILRRLVKKDGNRRVDPTDRLSDREMVVFQMLGQGLLIDEIAERLNLSRKTIEAYRRGAKEKLGFDTLSQLVCHGHDWISQNT